MQNLLGTDGPFQKDNYLKTELGGNFFLSLAEAEPETALECLKKTVGRLDKENLLAFTSGRRQVIWSLERIAMHRRLFTDAARLLLSLGEAENETYSNNASGVFAGLFSPAPGSVAPTEASPEERFPVLKEALESTSKAKRLLALAASGAALQHGQFIRTIGSEYQGLRELTLWTPKTWGEIFEAYRRVWQFIFSKLDGMETDEQEKAIRILLDHARTLGTEPNLLDMVVNTLGELSLKPYVKKEDVISTVVQILHYDIKNLPEKSRQRWEGLRDALIGTDYSSLLKRYVALDLIEDHFDESGKYVGQAPSKLEELAQQSIEYTELLIKNIKWLIVSETQNSFRFAYELGKRDVGFSLLQTLLEAQKESQKRVNLTLLGGYFFALNENNPEEWEKLLDKLTTDDYFKQLVPELTWRSGITDRALGRVLGLIKDGVASLNHLRMFTGRIGTISEETFNILLEFLLNRGEPSATSIVLHLYDSYYFRSESQSVLPEALTLKILTHKSLFQTTARGSFDVMDEFYWSLIARAFIKKYPSRSLEIACQILEHFGDEASIVTSHGSHALEILNQVTKEKPSEVWALIIQYRAPDRYEGILHNPMAARTGVVH